jgi:hypothetical protein
MHGLSPAAKGRASADDRARPILQRFWPEIVTAIALVCGFAVLRDMPLSNDVVWQFWIARQMLHGAKLYTDILEVNPPLWFWSALPLEAISDFAGFAIRPTVIAAIFCFITASVALIARLCETESPSQRAALLVTACLSLVIVPISDFGQREHLALIAALPYIALIARRAEGLHTTTVMAIVVGLTAAYGFSLKPHFVAVPVLLELGLLAYRRTLWRPIRAETLCLVVAAVAYGIAAWVIAPAFFTDIIPMVRLAYDGYEVPPPDVFMRPWVPVWIIGAFAIIRIRKVAPPIVILAALAVLGFAFSYFTQMKGWRYHALSASGCLTFAAGLAIVFWRGEIRTLIRHPELPLTFALFIVFGLSVGPYPNPYAGSARQALAPARHGDSVAVLSVNASLVWPMFDDLGLIWPLRHYTYWMIPALARAEAEKGREGLSAGEVALEQEILRDTAEDLWCRPPKLVVVDDTKRSGSMHNVDFDILKFFEREPAINELIAHYAVTNVVGRLTVYSKFDDPSAPTGLKCRPIAPPRHPLAMPR